jgi:fructuronate reductase
VTDGRRSRGSATPPVRIVHLGLGAFHRAHQAWYTDVVDIEREWGIAAFTGRSPIAARELQRQGGLFTVVERSAGDDAVRIVECLVEALDGADVDRFAELVAAPGTAIITITVTEAGYHLRADGEPDLDDPDVAFDVAALAGSDAELRGDAAPRTALGRILFGLRARRASKGGPLAIVPCDNLPRNGAMVRHGMLQLARRVDAGLADWIAENVSFVSTSVDRITPKTTDADLDTVQRLTGWRDRAAVVTEPFHDWLLSGSFPAGRPAWELAGAQFVDDIEPFELRKLWLLNGAHSLLAYSGLLRGHATVAEAIGDQELRSWVEEFWDEAARQLPEGLDLPRYRSALVERFENPRIEHRLRQIATDGVAKLRLRIVPSLLAERAAGREASAGIRAIAAWATLCRRGDELPDTAGVEVAAALRGEIPTAGLVRLVDPRLLDDAPLGDAIDRAVSLLRRRPVSRPT